MQQHGFFLGIEYDAADEWSQTTPGNHQFIVPTYSTTLRVRLWGGGAGGGGGGINSSTTSGAGGESRFKATDAGAPNDLIAGGGGGAKGRNAGSEGGAGGTATGGTINTPGDDGNNGSANTGARGGDGGGDGGSGGAQAGPTTGNATGNSGSSPGGGGGGGVATGPGGGGGGGGGGYVERSYAFGDLVPGSVVAVTIGNRGARGSGWRDGGLGSYGRIRIDWN